VQWRNADISETNDVDLFRGFVPNHRVLLVFFDGVVMVRHCFLLDDLFRLILHWASGSSKASRVRHTPGLCFQSRPPPPRPFPPLHLRILLVKLFRVDLLMLGLLLVKLVFVILNLILVGLLLVGLFFVYYILVNIHLYVLAFDKPHIGRTSEIGDG